MVKGQDDYSLYSIGYFILFIIFPYLLTFAYTYGTVKNLYHEQTIDVFRTSLQLQDAFTVGTLVRCFSGDDGKFAVELFTDERLQQCTSRPVRVTFERVGEAGKRVIGQQDLDTGRVFRDYVSLADGGGVLTLEFSAI